MTLISVLHNPRMETAFSWLSCRSSREKILYNSGRSNNEVKARAGNAGSGRNKTQASKTPIVEYITPRINA